MCGIKLAKGEQRAGNGRLVEQPRGILPVIWRSRLRLVAVPAAPVRQRAQLGIGIADAHRWDHTEAAARHGPCALRALTFSTSACVRSSADIPDRPRHGSVGVLLGVAPRRHRRLTVSAWPARRLRVRRLPAATGAAAPCAIRGRCKRGCGPLGRMAGQAVAPCELSIPEPLPSRARSRYRPAVPLGCA